MPEKGPHSSLTKSAPPVVKERRRRFGSAFILTVLILFLFGTICVARTDYFIHRVLTEYVLTWEQSLKRDLGPVKKILAIELSANPEELAAAIERGDGDAVAAIVRAGLNVNGEDSQGRLPIVRCVERGQGEILKTLLARGAELNRFDRSGRTPLGAAIAKNDIETTRMLLFTGADPNFRDGAGDTALHLAMREQNEAIAELLFTKGANPNLTDRKGRGPLFEAVEKQNAKLIAFLLERGANANTLDAERRSAAMVAGDKGDGDALRVLAERGGAIAVVPVEQPQGIGDLDVAIENMGTNQQQQDTAQASSPPRQVAAGAPAAAPKNSMTRVRALGEPYAIWNARNGTITLELIRAPVRNVGDVAAEGIVVKVKAPSGKIITLQGPPRLERNEKADYTASPNEVVPYVKRLEADATCSNCHKG